ncbi:MAG: hypothetical protein M3O30_08650 [Planctomycetota bacterium]|nr:hypothetical protein [Planctomycetota bacterium]
MMKHLRVQKVDHVKKGHVMKRLGLAGQLPAEFAQTRVIDMRRNGPIGGDILGPGNRDPHQRGEKGETENRGGRFGSHKNMLADCRGASSVVAWPQNRLNDGLSLIQKPIGSGWNSDIQVGVKP